MFQVFLLVYLIFYVRKFTRYQAFPDPELIMMRSDCSFKNLKNLKNSSVARIAQFTDQLQWISLAPFTSIPPN